MSEMTAIAIGDALPRPSSFRARTPLPLKLAVEEARPDAFAEGFAEGQRVAAEAFELERQSLLRLIERVELLQPEPSEELAAMIASAVETLVTEIVGASTVDRETLCARATAAAELVAEADGERVLYLNPADLALLDDAPLGLKMRGDDTLGRGDLRLACSEGWVEDGVGARLAALRIALGVSA